MNGKDFGWCFIGSGAITERVMKDLAYANGSWPVTVFSRNFANAERFAGKYGARPCRDAADAIADPAVRAVYVATPHPWHREYAVQALELGKPVLCEKPLTMNLADARAMVETARQRKVYLAEAMWTAHNPVTLRVLDWVREGKIGAVKSLYAAFSFHSAYHPDSRLFSPALGGGALLDVGVYTAAFARMVFGDAPFKIENAVAQFAESGVDSLCAVTVRWGGALARLFCGVDAHEPQDAFIGGESGHIVMPRFWAAKSAALVRPGGEEETFTPGFPGEGFHFEFDAVMEDVRAGRLENARVGHNFSLGVMGMLDDIRNIL